MLFDIQFGQRLLRSVAFLLKFICLFLPTTTLDASEKIVQLNVVFLMQEPEVSPALSNLDPVIRREGVFGARLGVEDNNTTGRFTRQEFLLTEIILSQSDDIIAEFRKQIKQNNTLFVVNLSASGLSEIAALPESKGTLLFDISTRSDALRNQFCHKNTLHMLPSRAMRSDALAQYMLKRSWRKWLLIIGPDEQDRHYATAIKRSAKRFGMKIVAEKSWTSTHDSRRTAQSEVPVLTQEEDYDVVVVADEKGLFGEYLAYRTWWPRPVIGTQGLVALAWHRTHEQWGAVQLQNRFMDISGRPMGERDYAAWLALRAIGESATRTGSADSSLIGSYILSDAFAVAGFKGKKLSFRKWNGQLRQPVLLAAPRSMVAVAPLEGFLHPIDELDSLGFDASEIACESN